MIMETKQFVYDVELTFDQNFNEWFYQCNDEREQWGEELLDRDEALAQFKVFFRDSIKNG